MMHKKDLDAASSDAAIRALFARLEEVRLSRNISQADLAKEAGVSRSTITRLAQGQSISMDSFVRVMLALGLADHLAALLPNPSVRPVERIRQGGHERRRASRKRKAAKDWTWGDA